VDAQQCGYVACVAVGKPAVIGRMLPVQVGQRVEVWGTPRAGEGGFWVEVFTWRKASRRVPARLSRMERWAIRAGFAWGWLERSVRGAAQGLIRREDLIERVGRREETVC
jgi:hypothetical protein